MTLIGHFYFCIGSILCSVKEVCTLLYFFFFGAAAQGGLWSPHVSVLYIIQNETP